LAKGSKNSCLVEFESGDLHVISKNAIALASTGSTHQKTLFER
jgi:hypothetical protein